MPQLIVTDANILIDLAEINEHRLLFLPHWEAATTYEVFLELREAQQASWQPFIDSGDLTLEEVSEGLIAETRAEVSRRLSDPDCTVLVLATQRKAIILSGDQALVKEYRNRGYEAHGILWLLDENERHERHTPKELHDFLISIMKINVWLPNRACELRIERWSRK